MFKFFEFKGGKFTTFPQLSSNNIKNYIFASIIILLVVCLSSWIKIDQKDIWKLYNVIIQHFGLQKQAPKIEIEKEIEARTELEIDKAIRDVIPEYDRIISDYDKKYKPIYIDGKNDESICYTDECKALSPPMRICSSVVEGIDCFK